MLTWSRYPQWYTDTLNILRKTMICTDCFFLLSSTPIGTVLHIFPLFTKDKWILLYSKVKSDYVEVYQSVEHVVWSTSTHLFAFCKQWHKASLSGIIHRYSRFHTNHDTQDMIQYVSSYIDITKVSKMNPLDNSNYWWIHWYRNFTFGRFCVASLNIL